MPISSLHEIALKRGQEYYSTLLEMSLSKYDDEFSNQSLNALLLNPLRDLHPMYFPSLLDGITLDLLRGQLFYVLVTHADEFGFPLRRINMYLRQISDSLGIDKKLKVNTPEHMQKFNWTMRNYDLISNVVPSDSYHRCFTFAVYKPKVQIPSYYAESGLIMHLKSHYEELNRADKKAAVRDEDYEAFRNAARCGQLIVTKWLYSRLGEADKKAALKALHYDAFIHAAANGHLEVAQWLYSKLEEADQKAALKANEYFAFRGAAVQGHLDVMEWLYSELDEAGQKEALKAYNYYAFVNAVNSNHLVAADWVYSKLDADEQKRALKTLNDNQFRTETWIAERGIKMRM